MIADETLILMALFIFAIFMLFALSIARDTTLFLMPAGIVMFLLSFASWDALANLPVTLALVVVGLVLMIVALEGITSREL
jgi:hypothetical protein